MMLRTLILTFALAAGTGLAAMDRTLADELVASGQQAYAAGDHEHALLLFDSVNTWYTSAGLLYNMGNCHFKAHDIPRAILYYERALRHSPGDEDIQANLELARQQIVDRITEMPSYSIGGSILRVAGAGDTDRWAHWSMWGWILSILLITGGWVVSGGILRRILFSAGGLALLITGMAVALASIRHSSMNDRNAGVIMTPRVEVRSEPREESTNLFILHKGTTVSILQELDAWMEISLPNGSVGWIKDGTLEVI